MLNLLFRRPKLWIAFALLLISVFAAHQAVLATVDRLVNVRVEFGTEVEEALARHTTREHAGEQAARPMGIPSGTGCTPLPQQSPPGKRVDRR